MNIADITDSLTRVTQKDDTHDLDRSRHRNRPTYTYDTPVTLGMLLEIAQAAHRDRHMPDAPPSLALAYINAIEDLIPNPYAGDRGHKFKLVE